ncbi:MAG: lamin tail domain-containing protein, partial [Acidimicrobiia bacterium]|nr:lamin tail domain-containing protein [Acidimicrobiia bacterium]
MRRVVFRLSKVLVLVALIAVNLAAMAGPALAVGSVVINEIHYNPGPGVNPDAEFLELHNPGDAPFDLSGMSFDGLGVLTFDPGTVLAPGAYVIVAPPGGFVQAEYGVVPLAEYSGGLSGAGETIQLLAPDGVSIVDEVPYDDVAPWPGGPDGNGPSLELVDPALDNGLSESWLASLGDPTPGAQNSVYSPGGPVVISDIEVSPSPPNPNQSFTVSATIPGASSATLTYKVDFGSDQNVSMTNPSGDIWQGTIPGQSAGKLVRYRISGGSLSSPQAGDTINYHGTVVNPTDISGNTLPVFHWFIESGDYNNLVNVTYLTNTYYPAVVAFGDQVIDNAQVRVRGQNSRNASKKNFKFELPDGYDLDFTPLALNPADEFAIQADFGDWTFTSGQVGWETFNEESLTEVSSFFTRVEQNGDFYGLYRYQDLYDGTWRNLNDIDDGELFKADSGWHNSPGFDKKNPDDGDYTSIQAAQNRVDDSPSSSKTAWIYDNVDIPQLVNYMAVTALMRHGDQRTHNFYIHFDETGRIENLPWDLDLTWRRYPPSRCSDDDMRTIECIDNELLTSMWEVSEIRDMYWRRLQTLVDKHLIPGQLEQRRVDLMNGVGNTNASLEVNKWGRSNIVTSTFQSNAWNDGIQERRDIFNSESRLPGSQSSNTPIIINELHYNPASGSEFIELYNPSSSESVDLSDWSINGLSVGRVAPGTVILPNNYVVLVSDDAAFQNDVSSNVLVVMQYTGALSNGGETITLSDETGTMIDVVTYDDASPWPTEPDGSGPSLSLFTPNSDNNLSSSWGISAANGGTPGAPNDAISTDSEAPTVTISEPTNGQTVTGPDVTIAGTAFDAGTGVDRVRLHVKDTGLNLYWDGSGWTSDWSWFDPGGTETWSYPMSLNSGSYQELAWAWDGANNISSLAQSSFSVGTADTTPPTVTITDPADGSNQSGPDVTISGTAADTQSGVSRVKVMIQRQSDST